MLVRQDNQQVQEIGAYVFLGWLGMAYHNQAELAGWYALGQTNGLVLAVWAVLFLWWWLLPGKRIAAILLAVWAVLHLVGGGILSVLPLGLFPFTPEQSVGHYLSHLIYTLSEVPIALAMLAEVRGGQRTGR